MWGTGRVRCACLHGVVCLKFERSPLLGLPSYVQHKVGWGWGGGANSAQCSTNRAMRETSPMEGKYTPQHTSNMQKPIRTALGFCEGSQGKHTHDNNQKRARPVAMVNRSTETGVCDSTLTQCTAPCTHPPPVRVRFPGQNRPFVQRVRTKRPLCKNSACSHHTHALTCEQIHPIAQQQSACSRHVRG